MLSLYLVFGVTISEPDVALRSQILCRFLSISCSWVESHQIRDNAKLQFAKMVKSRYSRPEAIKQEYKHA